MKAQLVMTVLIGLVTCGALAKTTVPECQNRPEFLSDQKISIAKESLPPLVYVGKSADYYIENKTQDFKIWSEQSFVKGTSRIVCATYSNEQSLSFSIYAPTLLDLKAGKPVGDSYWQFHVVANPKEFGLWNQKSRLVSKSKDLNSVLALTNARVQFFQTSHDEYEMHLVRESKDWMETLVIRFDAVVSVP